VSLPASPARGRTGAAQRRELLRRPTTGRPRITRGRPASSPAQRRAATFGERRALALSVIESADNLVSDDSDIETWTTLSKIEQP
jgi:hypothetical protein